MGLFFKQCPCTDTLLTGSGKCRTGLSDLLPWATCTQGPDQKTSSFSRLLRTLARFLLPTVTQPYWSKPLSSSVFSPALCGCVWDVVSGLKPIPLPWACVLTHTPGASTHTPGAHARTAGTDAVNWTLGAQRSQAERSLAQLEPEDVNRDRATASGQAQQRQTGLQEERSVHCSHTCRTLWSCVKEVISQYYLKIFTFFTPWGKKCIHKFTSFKRATKSLIALMQKMILAVL